MAQDGTAGGPMVLKFGGRSLGDPAAFEQSLSVITRYGPGSVIVVSAMEKVTDLLLGAARAALVQDLAESRRMILDVSRRYESIVAGLIRNEDRAREMREQLAAAESEALALCQSVATLEELTPRAQDVLVSRGERLSARWLKALMEERGWAVSYVDAVELIHVDRRFATQAPNLEKTEASTRARLLPLIEKGQTVIVPGFIGVTEDGRLVTLGRGGTDLSATLIGASLDSRGVYLCKEVDGILTADPRHVPSSRVVPELHYREAAELAYYGAKVLHPKTIIPLIEKKIPLYIKNTFFPDLPGTRIAHDVAVGEYPVRALTCHLGQALITVEGKGMMGVPGIAARTFEAMASADISVSAISQASSEASLCFVVPAESARRAEKALEDAFRFELAHHLVDRIVVQAGLSTIAVVGLGMRGTRGIAARTFAALAEAGVNVIAIAQGSSELNISMIVEEGAVGEALESLHREFRLHKIRTLPDAGRRSVQVAVFGCGQIGRTLVRQILDQKEYFKKHLGFSCQIIGLADRGGLHVKDVGYDPDALVSMLALKESRGRLTTDESPAQSLGAMREKLHHDLWQLPVGCGVFVDTTAEETAPLVKEALASGFHVVLANKKPLAVPQKEYEALFEAALAGSTTLRYEATVGAGLPVLDTLAKLAEAGDRAETVLGCLSGTLGYVMSVMSRGKLFSQAVREAYHKGYTEPHPGDDLSGMDVGRKTLILARAMGHKLDLTDIGVQPLYPAELHHPDPETFLTKLESLDGEMSRRLELARSKGATLRFIARISGDQIRVGMEEVPEESPFGRLHGTDNQVCFHTRRYKENPLVVTGPGAGAEVTAAGVLGDILAIATTDPRLLRARGRA